MPNSGGWLEQPAKFNDVIDIIEAEIGAMNKELEQQYKKFGGKP